ncbi:hypothetical protein VE02_06486 [Pseudogymnoascus sp. 03VT05]|nr:hypothetical protein VE02_06486 [Pseudogymnoascus sp. 03VT05]
MADLDDYNSDEDIVLIPEEESSRGKQLADKMLESALRHRKESKQSHANLRHVFENVLTDRFYKVWSNRWDSWYTGVLRQQQSTPTTESLCRFITSITHTACEEKISKRRESGVPGVEWIQRGISAVIVTIRFRNENWEPAPNAGSHIKATINTLLQNEFLTRDPVREKAWVTMKVVEKLALQHFTYHLCTEPKSWTVAIMRILSWTLQTAVDGRCGDVTLTKGHSGILNTLLWSDVRIRIKSGNIENLLVALTLRNSKHNRGIISKQTVKLIPTINDTNRNTINVAFLLLIHGLRNGVFQQDDINGLIQAAHGNDGYIKYRNDEVLRRPVISQIANNGHELIQDKPAPSEQVTNSLRISGDISGVEAKLTSHDLKRGYVRDYVYTPALKNNARADVAQNVNHSNKTRGDGVTQTYVGPNALSGFQHRLENGYEDNFMSNFGVKYGTQYKKARLTTDEVDAELKTGEDSKDNNARQRAAWRIHDKRYQDHCRGKSLTTAALATSAPTGAAPATSAPTGAAPATSAPTGAVPTTAAALDSEAIASGDCLAADAPDASALVAQILFEEEISESERITIEASLGQGNAGTVDERLTGTATEFISQFATIKSLSERIVTERRQHPAKSGKFFLFRKCPYFEVCGVEAIGITHLQVHMATCVGRIPQSNPDPEAKQHKCSTCDKSFLNIHARNYHVTKEHKWSPKQCKDAEMCGFTQLWPSATALGSHRQKYHSSFIQTTCRYPGCIFPKLYTLKDSYKYHLRSVHGIHGATEQNKYFAAEKK